MRNNRERRFDGLGQGAVLGYPQKAGLSNSFQTESGAT
ncbi:hypothetical protein PECL_396 [Pediococcus claussenii ATCC BAA-344]|uniref:Uncharacterized protein n=1 Tax=Pediococcus claussenii (strain ATCC BAA-344 / DSM 14800 / JCM 18046 / KCTC 3811 / LMG 21948 / P06) TaxID=701521 RepID=G8PB73_PEDCP|nr:hypothetical protein PECL_396 [Pediococcus claussenii ATCC BAA-344]